MPKKILVADDEPQVARLIASRLMANKYEVIVAHDALYAVKKAVEEAPDLIILDIKMPGLSGIDVMKETAKFSPQTKFLAISGYDSDEVADAAFKAGAVDFITKPQTPAAILLKVKDILTKSGKYAPK